MLTINGGLVDAETVSAIVKCCAPYGTVAAIHIDRSKRPPQCRLRMSTIQETQALLLHVGGLPDGDFAHINLAAFDAMPAR